MEIDIEVLEQAAIDLESKFHTEIKKELDAAMAAPVPMDLSVFLSTAGGAALAAVLVGLFKQLPQALSQLEVEGKDRAEVIRLVREYYYNNIVKKAAKHKERLHIIVDALVAALADWLNKK